MEVVITDILRIIRISFEKEFYPDYKIYFWYKATNQVWLVSFIYKVKRDYCEFLFIFNLI